MKPLVAINGAALDVAAAIRTDMFHNSEFINSAVEQLLVRQYAQQHGIYNTDEELQVAADEMRYQRNLESREATLQWLKMNHQTVQSVQESLDFQILRNKIRFSVPEEELKAYFAEHQLDFDEVELFSIRLDSEEMAQELYTQIQEEGASFHQMAIQHSQDEVSGPRGGYVGNLSRADLSGEIEAAVFSARPGEVVGPIQTEKGWNLFMVSAFRPADFEKTRSTIIFLLYEDLLARLKAESDIRFPLLEEEQSPVPA